MVPVVVAGARGIPPQQEFHSTEGRPMRTMTRAALLAFTLVLTATGGRADEE